MRRNRLAFARRPASLPVVRLASHKRIANSQIAGQSAKHLTKTDKWLAEVVAAKK